MFPTAPYPKAVFPKFWDLDLTPTQKNIFWTRNLPKPCFGKAFGTDLPKTGAYKYIRFLTFHAARVLLAYCLRPAHALLAPVPPRAHLAWLPHSVVGWESAWFISHPLQTNYVAIFYSLSGRRFSDLYVAFWILREPSNPSRAFLLESLLESSSSSTVSASLYQRSLVRVSRLYSLTSSASTHSRGFQNILVA
jgi:hypothetical protein